MAVPYHPELPTVEVPLLERIPIDPGDGIALRESIPFVIVHVVALVGIFLIPPTFELLLMTLGLLWLRLLGVTLAYHRYFAHRAFRTSRVFQFMIALWAVSSAQKGVLWWAGHHRIHHRESDTPGDVHSPGRSGFLWSHLGWILSRRYNEAPLEAIRDMARFPELRWLDRHNDAPTVAFAVVCFLVGGWTGLIWGYFVGTVLLWHSTFTINSLCHVVGRRRYPTTDTSRNNFWLSLLTLGEGWHNNHHYFCSSARNGFFWWEWDPTFSAIWLLEKLGIVWDVNLPPSRVLEAGSHTA